MSFSSFFKNIFTADQQSLLNDINTKYATSRVNNAELVSFLIKCNQLFEDKNNQLEPGDLKKLSNFAALCANRTDNVTIKLLALRLEKKCFKHPKSDNRSYEVKNSKIFIGAENTLLDNLNDIIKRINKNYKDRKEGFRKIQEEGSPLEKLKQLVGHEAKAMFGTQESYDEKARLNKCHYGICYKY